MISLNDYLYDGNTIVKILHMYSQDLKKYAIDTGNSIDMAHSNYLLQVIEVLEHNEFLSVQSQQIREFYKYMAVKYPFLAFTFKGRIKSLIRLEEKINGNIYDYYSNYGKYPTETGIKERINRIRDLIAYRIVISLPKCHLRPGEDCRERELKYLYEIANALPDFLEERGFNAELSGIDDYSMMIDEKYRPYYRDYIDKPGIYGYQSLHISFFDNTSRSNIEVQLRTKEMDDFAEIGPANHLGYEKRQEKERARREKIPQGENIIFDDAYNRVLMLQQLELKNINVNMFGAADNNLINDGCGLYRGRLILPYEHLSKFQNDLID